MEPRFLIIVRVSRTRPLSAEALPAELFDRLILYGALTTLDGAEPIGVAMALQAPDRQHVAALIDDEQAGIAAFSEIEVFDWGFGGRR